MSHSGSLAVERETVAEDRRAVNFCFQKSFTVTQIPSQLFASSMQICQTLILLKVCKLPRRWGNVLKLGNLIKITVVELNENMSQ